MLRIRWTDFDKKPATDISEHIFLQFSSSRIYRLVE